MQTNSFIALPTNLEDPIVLRRFLSILIERLDMAFGARGNQGFAGVNRLGVTTATLSDVVRKVNTLALNSINKDEPLTTILQYTNNVSISHGNDLVSKDYVDSLYIPQPSIPLISSTSTNSEILNIANTLDNLITTLKLSKILV